MEESVPVNVGQRPASNYNESTYNEDFVSTTQVTQLGIGTPHVPSHGGVSCDRAVSAYDPSAAATHPVREYSSDKDFYFSSPGVPHNNSLTPSNPRYNSFQSFQPNLRSNNPSNFNTNFKSATTLDPHSTTIATNNMSFTAGHLLNTLGKFNTPPRTGLLSLNQTITLDKARGDTYGEGTLAARTPSSKNQDARPGCALFLYCPSYLRKYG